LVSLLILKKKSSVISIAVYQESFNSPLAPNFGGEIILTAKYVAIASLSRRWHNSAPFAARRG